jgi:hypothetical protein
MNLPISTLQLAAAAAVASCLALVAICILAIAVTIGRMPTKIRVEAALRRTLRTPMLAAALTRGCCGMRLITLTHYQSILHR